MPIATHSIDVTYWIKEKIITLNSVEEDMEDWIKSLKLGVVAMSKSSKEWIQKR